MLTINAPRLLDDLREVSRLGATPAGGVHRPALSPADLEARAWFRARVEAAGLVYRQDGAGNLSAILPTTDPAAQTLLCGSHLDSVPDGGRFDGALGVLAALEALRTIQEAGLRLPVHLEAISFTDEEGTHISLLGSRAVAGLLTEDDLDHPHSSPDAFAGALARAGLRRQELLTARRDPATLLGYLELHIEQGPRLEDAGLEIGVVTAIVGIRSFWLTFNGQAAHAGTTPLATRRDALRGAAAFLTQATEIISANFPPGTVTCGQVAVAPGAFNIVPGCARLALEFRHPAAETLNEMEATLFALARDCAAAHGLTLEIATVGGVEPATFDPGMVAAIEAAAGALGLRYTRLASFAGHDAQAMQAITPAAMLFVPSVGGLSHHPGEYTRDADVINGANVLLNTLMNLAGAG